MAARHFLPGSPDAQILLQSDRSRLTAAIRTARLSGRTIDVQGYSRLYYYLRSPAHRTLARWRDLEVAVLRLCKALDRDIVLQEDRLRARKAISLLEDTVLPKKGKNKGKRGRGK